MKTFLSLRLLAALLGATPVWADVAFTDSSQNLGTNNTTRSGNVLADFDRDGDLDTVMIGTRTVIWINQGFGQERAEGTFASNG